MFPLSRLLLAVFVATSSVAAAGDINASDRAALTKAFIDAGKIQHPGDDPANGDGSPYDFFGSSIAIDGDTAVIGVSGDDTLAGDGAGSAYVYTRSAGVWT